MTVMLPPVDARGQGIGPSVGGTILLPDDEFQVGKCVWQITTRSPGLSIMGVMTYIGMGSDDTPASASLQVSACQAAADAAAQAADIRIRELLNVGDLSDACDLINKTWASGTQEPLITVSMLRALTHAGNYAAGAFADGRLVGAAVGFRGDRGAGQELHSHITAVAPGFRNRNVGFALKLHQRSWALLREIPTITWTFDPLVCRNAFFNLVKLGAQPVTYLRDFYGAMTDAVNAGDDSDRVLVEWRLTEPRVVRACAGDFEVWKAADMLAQGWETGLDEDPEGLPVAGEPSGDLILVRVPLDIELLRRERSDVARAWRRSVRDVLGALMAEGASVSGFLRDGWYVLERSGPRAE
jgi:predicted GNAT superfamily acetyltransferase